MVGWARYAIYAALLLLGVLAMVSGESDDSPGLQGIGLILIITVSVPAWRHYRRTR